MPRASFDYTQTVLGKCGHIMSGWPIVSKQLGGGDPWIACDDCTREEYGLLPSDGTAVWVRIVEKSPEKPKPPKKPREKKPPKPNPWDQFMPGSA